ncbi:hypothetical protein CR152_22985 [Massilia violaceinigra]|uniref:Uncharacterized protein n=2 Tax=Massilia violaceinigra TaxID=2045208 RepID=A0A2D2DQ19_9BURK|nr:hypothetical protein CR152_22985 [Massilia violaceinigra]
MPANPTGQQTTAAPSAAPDPAGANEAAAPPRSPSLLPTNGDDPDGRFAVAEEVSLDQQSDSARQIGASPPDPAPGTDVAGAVAGTLAPADEQAPAAKAGSGS